MSLLPEERLLLNPRLDRKRAEAFAQWAEAAPPSLRNHFWLSTSGTTGRPKLVALSRDALLASAEAVNRHLESGPFDVWVNVLPLFHVGGLAILARAEESGAKAAGNLDPAALPPWSPEEFLALLAREKATLTSLVPTQVYDLAARRLSPPPSLRAVLVGGARLEKDLYLAARRLGWPLLPTYGSTEVASQAATAELSSLEEFKYPSLRILSHIQVREEEGFLAFRGPSLFTAILEGPGKEDLFQRPRGSWWRSEDLGRVRGNCLEILGRAGDFVKVGGEAVGLPALRERLEALARKLSFPGDALLAARPDSRLGTELILVYSGAAEKEAKALVLAFNEEVLPFERIRAARFLESIPRTPLGKIAWGEIPPPEGPG